MVTAEDILQSSCAIWDFDGTLFNLRVDWLNVKQKIAELLGRGDDAQISPDIGLNAYVSLSRSLGLAPKVFEILERAELAALEDWDSSIIAESLHLLLETRSRSIIISNNMSRTISKFLSRAGAPEIPFRSRDMVNKPKPHPEGLLALRDRWENRKCVLIGNSSVDEHLARSCGIPFLHVQHLTECDKPSEAKVKR